MVALRDTFPQTVSTLRVTVVVRYFQVRGFEEGEREEGRRYTLTRTYGTKERIALKRTGPGYPRRISRRRKVGCKLLARTLVIITRSPHLNLVGEKRRSIRPFFPPLFSSFFSLFYLARCHRRLLDVKLGFPVRLFIYLSFISLLYSRFRDNFSRLHHPARRDTFHESFY